MYMKYYRLLIFVPSDCNRYEVRCHPYIVTEDIKEFMQRLEKEVNPDYTRSLATQSVLTFPTQMGIPCYFNASYVHTLRLTGKARVSSNPLEKSSDSFTVNVELDPR